MDKAVLEQFEIFSGKDVKRDDWLWCSRCGRCYRVSEFRTLKDNGEIFLFCHYKDCDGDLPLDSRLWAHLASEHPELPKIPRRGKSYDLRPSPYEATDMTPEKVSPDPGKPKDAARWNKVNFLWNQVLEGEGDVK